MTFSAKERWKTGGGTQTFNIWDHQHTVSLGQGPPALGWAGVGSWAMGRVGGCTGDPDILIASSPCTPADNWVVLEERASFDILVELLSANAASL